MTDRRTDEERQKRLADALRANLRRRKQQDRDRTAPPPDEERGESA